ncbi:DUF4390 domain-containing protein [candidate division KSB1 bacterium]|nr:DUF4390 domain-containing protein [candidate division KSB1 bacterium]
MRAIFKLILLCLPLLATASQAQEPQLVLDTLRIEAGRLLVDFHVDSLLVTPLWEGMQRGITSAARFRVQLWRKRGFLLNSVVAERDFEIKTAFDPWEQQYLVQTWEERRLTKSREFVQQQWEQHRNWPLSDTTQLNAKHRYYLVIELHFEPVSRESLREIRGWLAGEMKTMRHRDSTEVETPQKSRGLQDRMLNFVVDLTGLGEQALSLKSGFFRIVKEQIVFEE